MSAAEASGTLPGVDAPRVDRWLAEHVADVGPPFSYTLIAGGRSNLTYRVVDANGTALVLRRPPLGNVLATAHDMGREHRIISALATTPVPVAPALGFCDDPDVNGAPFYVMAFVDGAILANRDDAEDIPVPARAVVCERLIDVMARIHEVDPDAVGLGTLGRKEGYIERQLRRWHAQVEGSKTRELPALDEVHRLLSSRIPVQRWTGIVHGDYRLGNLIVGDDGEVRAVLDWELATLGDTLADLAWLLSYWVEPGEEGGTVPPATVQPGFATRAELVELYHARTSRDLSELPYYLAFARWRLACIGEGVYARYRAGVMGDSDFDVELHGRSVERSAEAALKTLQDWR